MAQNDNAVFTASRGYIFTAPINTAAPTPSAISAFNPTTGIASWENIGHTSDDELPEFGFDGGDTETRGSWQNTALKEVVTEAIADFVTFNAHQFDEATLKLYYGVTDPGSTAGQFDITSTGKTTEKALLIVVVDGDVTIAFYAGRTSIRRNDAISMDTDSFAFLPLRATILKGTGPLMSWISEDTGVNITTP